MKYKNVLLIVKNMEKTIIFYEEVLGLHVIMDFGANKTLTGGLSLQTLETWTNFITTDEVFFGSHNFEIYFEEEDFDHFLAHLKKFDITYVHPVKEHPWGQRVIRFYDPDRHIIEVGENINVVCNRFLDSGMTPEQVATRMDVPMKFVKACIRQSQTKKVFNKQDLLLNLHHLHTTELGYLRLKKNLSLDINDIVAWCIEKIKAPEAIITRKGKNWYVEFDHCMLTINANNFSIITAHKKR